MTEADIIKIATDFSNAKSAVAYGRMGVSVQQFGLLSQFLIMLLNVLKGSLDSVGGLMFTNPAANILDYVGKGYVNKTKTRVRGLTGFGGEYPVSTLAEEILTPGEGQIKAMFIAGGNPLLSTPNGNQLTKAFEGLEFMFAVDFYITESTRHANIILPPVGPLERDHFDLVFNGFAVRNTVKYSEALFPKKGNTKNDWEIYLDLAGRMQRPTLTNTLRNKFSKKMGPRGVVDLMLRRGPYGGGANLFKGLTVKRLIKQPHGIDLGALKPCLPQGLRTKGKKMNLSLDHFMADLKRVDAHFFSGKKSEALVNEKGLNLELIGRRNLRSNNSWLHNSQRMFKGKSVCTAMIHPIDADKLGVENNQLIKVSSRVGTLNINAEVSDEIMPGVISIPHGWGHNQKGTKWTNAEKNPGVNVNILTDDTKLDELSGNAVLNGVPVTVEVIS
jgi:anaerobic selenocysteine-containing dehydrogenase